jgi:hypothetical protein
MPAGPSTMLGLPHVPLLNAMLLPVGALTACALTLAGSALPAMTSVPAEPSLFWTTAVALPSSLLVATTVVLVELLPLVLLLELTLLLCATAPPPSRLVVVQAPPLPKTMLAPLRLRQSARAGSALWCRAAPPSTSAAANAPRTIRLLPCCFMLPLSFPSTTAADLLQKLKAR